MRFYLDEDVTDTMAAVARERGMNMLSTSEAGRNGQTDRSQLEYASREERCLITVNCKDFIRLTIEYAAAGLPHCGILCTSQQVQRKDVSRFLDALQGYIALHPQGLPPYFLDYLSW